jgi:hypothetical protein
MNFLNLIKILINILSKILITNIICKRWESIKDIKKIFKNYLDSNYIFKIIIFLFSSN